MTPDPILQDRLAVDPRTDPRLARLPGVQPLNPGDWIRVDEAYAPQMAERARLLAARPRDVLACLPEGRAAAAELLAELLEDLSARDGFTVAAGRVRRPDGREVPIDRDAPLWTAGHLVQEDFCLLDKAPGEAEHRLVAAVLCFPASWTLAEKIGRPLFRIHRPVADYDAGMAARVQRLFDGVRPGRPLWRANAMAYADPALHQPRPEAAPRRADAGPLPFTRSEVQTIRRLPRTGAVAFGIHTCVVRSAPEGAEEGAHPAGTG